MINFIKKNLDIIIYLFIFVLFYKSLFFYGDFVRDDWSIKSLYHLNFFEALKGIFGPFSNRPFAALFFAITSRFSDEFIFYLSLNFVLIFISSYLIISSLYFINISNKIKNFYVFLTLFPLFSYSVIFSSGMQITGNLSVLIWSFSFYLQNQFITKNKFLSLIISNLFILLMLLTYESALPLLSLNIMFLFFFKRDHIFKYFFILILTIILGTIIQKVVIGNFYPDISRLRIENLSFNKILFYFFGNGALLINNFFVLFQNFFSSIKNIFVNKLFFSEYLLIIILLYFVIFNKTQNIKKDIQDKKKIILFSVTSLILCFLFIVLIHTLALSGTNIYGYNNRALISVSFILPLFLIIIGETLKPRNSKILYFFYILIVFTNYILILDKNVEYVKYRNSTIKTIISEYKGNTDKKNYVLFIDHYGHKDRIYQKVTFINDNFDYRHLLEIESKGSLMGTSINNNKYCNKTFWDNYFKTYVKKWFNKNNNIYIVDPKNSDFKFNLFNDLNEVWLYLDKNLKCEIQPSTQENINIYLKKKGNQNFINDSLLLKFGIKFYYKYLSKNFVE